MTRTKASRLGFIRKVHAINQAVGQTSDPSYSSTFINASLTTHASRIRAEKCKRSFSYFIKYFWDQISVDVLQWNWHMDYLADELMEVARRVGRGEPREYDLTINIPPGTSKSSICSIMFPVWCWINWPWMRFINTSYSGALSLEHAEISRDLVKSRKFKDVFPSITIKQDKDTKSNFRLVYTDDDNALHIGGSRLSTSVGGTLTGFHGHILIVDDPIDPNRSISTVELKSTNHWMDQTLSTRKINKEVTPTILIMQRLHQNDPTGHILAKNKTNVKHISLPGDIREYREQLKPSFLACNYIDGLLDPTRMSWKALMDMKSNLGQYGYSGQIGQHPVPPSGGMFKVEAFSIITPSRAVDMEFEIIIRYWDKAATANGGAFATGVKMAKVAKEKKWVILDVKRGQWATDERERIIRATAEADGTGVIVWHEQEPGSGGKDSAHATTSNLSGFVVYSERATGDKVYRADPYSVQVNEGNVMLVQSDWNHEYIEECRFFPFGTYKDQVDASSGAFNRMNGGKKGWIL